MAYLVMHLKKEALDSLRERGALVQAAGDATKVSEFFRELTTGMQYAVIFVANDTAVATLDRALPRKGGTP